MQNLWRHKQMFFFLSLFEKSDGLFSELFKLSIGFVVFFYLSIFLGTVDNISRNLAVLQNQVTKAAHLNIFQGILKEIFKLISFSKEFNSLNIGINLPLRHFDREATINNKNFKIIINSIVKCIYTWNYCLCTDYHYVGGLYAIYCGYHSLDLHLTKQHVKIRTTKSPQRPKLLLALLIFNFNLYFFKLKEKVFDP